MKSYKELDVWQQGVLLVEQIYRLTRSFPKEETYGLVSQLRRAAISIPSNIAEGAGRGSRKEYAQFAAIAHGSCCEIETQIILCDRLGLVPHGECEKIARTLAGIGRMLKALSKSLRNSETQKP